MIIIMMMMLMMVMMMMVMMMMMMMLMMRMIKHLVIYKCFLYRERPHAVKYDTLTRCQKMLKIKPPPGCNLVHGLNASIHQTAYGSGIFGATNVVPLSRFWENGAVTSWFERSRAISECSTACVSAIFTFAGITKQHRVLRFDGQLETPFWRLEIAQNGHLHIVIRRLAVFCKIASSRPCFGHIRSVSPRRNAYLASQTLYFLNQNETTQDLELATFSRGSLQG